jgi:hypothetical protein
VTSIKPRGLDSGDEELRPISVGTGIRHRKVEGCLVFENEILIGEFFTIDATLKRNRSSDKRLRRYRIEFHYTFVIICSPLATCSVPIGEISALEHKIGDDAVEDGPLVMEGLARFSHPLLPGAESTEVLSSFWNGITEQSENDSTSLASFDGLEW